MSMSTEAYLFFGYCAEDDESWPDPHDDGWEEREAIEEKYGVDIDWHGSDGYAMPFLAIKASRITAHRGYPKIISTLPVCLTEESWEDRLKGAAEELGIDVVGVQPGWWLASYWG